MRLEVLVGPGIALAVLGILLLVVLGSLDGGRHPSAISDARSVPTASRGTGVSQLVSC